MNLCFVIFFLAAHKSVFRLRRSSDSAQQWDYIRFEVGKKIKEKKKMEELENLIDNIQRQKKGINEQNFL